MRQLATGEALRHGTCDGDAHGSGNVRLGRGAVAVTQYLDACGDRFHPAHRRSPVRARRKPTAAWVYGVIFLIVFAETGLVVTPILPGDSLLFAAGALCGAGTAQPGNHGDGAPRRRHHRRRGQLQRWAEPRAEGVRRPRSRAAGCTGSSTASISRRHTRSSRSTAVRLSSSRDSCRSCGRSCRSSPAPAT